MGKKIRVYGKIKLYETSVVGIPAYPDAHFSTNTSLIKSLSKGFTEEDDEDEEDQLNFEEEEMEEAKIAPVSEVEKKVEVAPAQVEKAVEAKVDMNEIKKAISEAIAEAKVAETERGLVAKQETLKDKSIGQLAMDCGLFTVK